MLPTEAMLGLQRLEKICQLTIISSLNALTKDKRVAKDILASLIRSGHILAKLREDLVTLLMKDELCILESSLRTTLYKQKRIRKKLKKIGTDCSEAYSLLCLQDKQIELEIEFRNKIISLRQ